ncbi:hypothetical protein ACFC09_36315 [Streptomyces sp. NPDC056161]|uniref:hypothetical protein n=1 Tax=Streptomyces sp. NPDC056161 TaxID=3345732 RepID=UPI0035D6D2E8
MPELKVEIDGQMLPLTGCYWIQSAPCGCIVALTTTTKPKGKTVKVLASAEQAHEHMVPLKRERDDESRRGYTWALVAKDRYHAELSDAWECGQHQRATTDPGRI